jgi:hypothetical protein
MIDWNFVTASVAAAAYYSTHGRRTRAKDEVAADQKIFKFT